LYAKEVHVIPMLRRMATRMMTGQLVPDVEERRIDESSQNASPMPVIPAIQLKR
jgi:hypothetical protein